MKNYSRFLLAGALCVATLGSVACSDDSSSTAPANDEIQKSYVCDEGQWVKGNRAEGETGGCLKGDDNTMNERPFLPIVETGGCFKGDDNILPLLTSDPTGETGACLGYDSTSTHVRTAN